MKQYESVSNVVWGNAWAILESDYKLIEGILASRLAGDFPTDTEIEARANSRSYGSSPVKTPRKIAIVPLHGPILNRAPAVMSQMSGMTSPQAFGATLRALADDPDIKEVVLDVDSPGGTVSGINAAVEGIRYLRDKKKVTAVVNDTGASAAYWVAAQASRIVATPTAQLGSISIIAKHIGTSKAEEAEGKKTTILRTGAKKALGMDGEELTDEAKDDLLADMQKFHDLFVADIAVGRNISVKQASTWADGRIFVGQEAVDAGLADELGTLESVLANIEGNTVDRETLRAEHPELYNALIEEGKLAAKPTQSAADESTALVALETKVAELSAHLEDSKLKAKEEKRLNIAATALEAAKLPAFPKVEGMDLAASFRHRIEAMSLSAATDEEARQKVEAAIAEQKAVMGTGKAEPKQKYIGAALPSGNTEDSLNTTTQAKSGSVFGKARQRLGLS